MPFGSEGIDEAHRPGDVRRRLPRHALPPRHAVALERARVPPEDRSDLERLRRLDHLRSPGRSLAPPAMGQRPRDELPGRDREAAARVLRPPHRRTGDRGRDDPAVEDRKSTRLNSSHSQISYAVFCLKKKKTTLTNNKNRQKINNKRSDV